MGKLFCMELCKNNDLHLYQLSVLPEHINEGYIEDLDNVTAIGFSYEIDDGTMEMNSNVADRGLQLGFGYEKAYNLAVEKKTTEEFYFIGEIVDYSKIKDLLKDVPEEQQKLKYAITYDENGEIFDCKAVLNKATYPVKSKEELYKIYYEKTGYKFPVAEETNHKKGPRQ